MKKLCKICGEEGYLYFPYCKKHLSELKTNEPFVNTKCIICGEKTNNNFLFCPKCYKTSIKEIKNSFDHNRDRKKILNHYNSLKEVSLECYNKEDLIDTICLMYALAEELNDIYKNDYLLNKVPSHIQEAFKKFEEKKLVKEQNNKETFNDIDFRKKWPAEHQCEDGHYVRSLSEMAIDNWLYNHNYVHAYEKSVYMETEPEAVVLSDFYIPEADLYIEFWGLEDDERYNNRKQIKIKLYDDNQYLREDLSEKDIKRLNDIMPRLLGKYINKRKKIK